MLTNELWSKLRIIMNQFDIYDKVYCIGKEIKSGIQNIDPWAIVRATGCIYILSFCREMVALKVKKS